MGLFTSRADLESKIESLEKENGDLRADVKRLEGELKVSQDDLASATQTITEAPTAEHLTQLTKERDEAKAEAAPEKIEAKAIKLLSDAESAPAVQKIIAARVTEELSKAGQPVAVENTDKETKETSNLTGFAKVSAAFAKK